MSHDPRIRLADILQSIEQIESYTEGVSREQFLDDRKTQDAVTRRIEIIGEAVKGLSETQRSRHPHIPWSSIAGTRDKLIHDYGHGRSGRSAVGFSSGRIGVSAASWSDGRNRPYRDRHYQPGMGL